MASNANKNLWEQRGLAPLRELPNVRMADDEPDVRGWEVRSPSGARVGRVDDLLVDRSAGEVGAMLVTPATASRGPMVLPIDRVSIRDRDRCIVARDGDALLSLDDRGTADAGSAGGAPQRRSGVDDLPVRQATDARTGDAADTRVTVERTEDGEEIVRVPVVEERLVVQPVVTDTIVIRKRAVREEQIVEGDLRRERIDVDRRGDA